MTSQQSGMSCGKSSHHVSLLLLTTQVTHPAISDEGYDCTRTSPKDAMATLKGKRQGERGEQQTPQTTGKESENVRRMSQEQFCLIFHAAHTGRNRLMTKKKKQPKQKVVARVHMM